MKTLRTSLIALALVSSSAFAQQHVSFAFENALVDDGLGRISEGLYGQRNGGDESYVAYTPAGQQALLERLIQLRDERPHGDRKTATVPGALDRLIETLSAPALNGERYGDCNGAATSGPFHVQASAAGGLTASASAQNTSSPTINTTNTAYADALDTSSNTTGNNATTAGNTTASATVSAPVPRRACQTTSAATITCPGASHPAISAFATSTVNGQPCLQ